MNNPLFAAVDLGTSFIKVGIYDLIGQLHAAAFEPVRDERPAAGVFIQRGDLLFHSVVRCLQKAVFELGTDAKHVCAIAFTGQMAGAIGVKKDWQDVTTWSCSMDTRYLPYAERQRSHFGDEIYALSGASAPVMCCKYDWFRNEFPIAHRSIEKYVMLNGYVIGRLSEQSVEAAKIDATLIAWTGLANIVSKSWSDTLCEAMNIDMNLLPEIVDSTAVGGTLAQSQARMLGLPSGIPLVMGAGDKVSGCVGANVMNPGDLIFEASSYGAISCMVEGITLSPDRNYDLISAAGCSGYYAHKYIQGSGITIDWCIRNFFDGDFNRAESMASELPAGSGKLLSIGLLSGSTIPFDSEIRGMTMGYTLNHGKGNFYHALLEGFSYDLALTLDSIHAMYPQYKSKEIKLIGGGAKSAIWPQMLADVTGHAFTLLDRSDVALWGTAMLAARSVGAIEDLRETADRFVSGKRTYYPDSQVNRSYAPYIRLYARAVQELHELYADLNAIETRESFDI